MVRARTAEARFPALRGILSPTLYALELSIIAVSYFAIAGTALLLPGLNPAATPQWPPTGVSLALVLLRGYRIWPAIFVGSLSANTISLDALTASSFLQSSAIGIGTTLGALAGAWLINHQSHGVKTFQTAPGIARFVLISFAPTAMVSSAIATATTGLLAATDLRIVEWTGTWIVWWLADAAGSVLVTPVIVLWALTPVRADSKWNLLETSAIVVLAGTIGVIAFLPQMVGDLNILLPHRLLWAFLILLPLTWAALRGNQRAAATAAAIFCGVASWGLSTIDSLILTSESNGWLVLLLALAISTSVAPLLLSVVILNHQQTQRQMKFKVEHTQAVLKTASRHFQIFVEGVADYAMFVLDTSGRVASWNRNAQKITGYGSEEIIGKHFSIFYRPDERRAGEPHRALELAKQNSRHEVEGWRTRKDGTPFFVTGALTVIRDDNSNLIGFANIIRDATERRDTQEKLVEAREQLAMAQKMEAIGKLTGGIAHDFNNLLMIIGGNAQMFKRLLDPKLPRAIEAIQTAAKRGEGLTRQLLTFSRRQHLSPTVVDLNASITNMRTMIESSLHGNIVYKENITPELWPVKVDLAELELSIVNIAVNARDAMPNGGVFTVRAGNVKAYNEGSSDQSDFVAIEFSDTGIGIPGGLLSKIFDPYFTTKEVGKGTGLGLSQVYGFAHQAGGLVQAESKVGHGTAITIYLPSYAGNDIEVTEPSEVDSTRSQRPTVLVVDDSTEVAEVTSSLFEYLGYDTIYRESAEAALKLLAEGTKLDLVFSDIVMPGPIDGVGLAGEVQSRYPHLPVILTTGYSDAAHAAPADLRILRKPFDADALRRFLQNMIETRRSPSAYN
jgi:PAS domain S-box-containing protein